MEVYTTHLHNIFTAGFGGNESDRFRAIRAPKELPIPKDDQYTFDLWCIGWQHRSYGSYQDPIEALAESVMAVIWSEGTLHEVLVISGEDNIAADLH